VLGTVAGSLEADERFDATRSQEGGASPLLFPATLATAPAAELSIRLGLRGPVQVVSSGETSFLAAIATARRWLEDGDATIVLACGLEVAPRSTRALGPGPFAESVACLVLEREGTRELDRSLSRASPLERRVPRFLGNASAPALARALTEMG
jgi:acetyl-CoA acetyltransferase